MFSWLFGKSRVYFRDDEMLVIRYRSRMGSFYIGAMDTECNFVETKATLESMGRLMETQPHFQNSFFTDHERLGFCLRELGFETWRSIGDSRAWFFERSPSVMFVTTVKPRRSAYQMRNLFMFAKSKKILETLVERAVLKTVEENRMHEEST